MFQHTPEEELDLRDMARRTAEVTRELEPIGQEMKKWLQRWETAWFSAHPGEGRGQNFWLAFHRDLRASSEYQLFITQIARLCDIDRTVDQKLGQSKAEDEVLWRRMWQLIRGDAKAAYAARQSRLRRLGIEV